MTEKKIHIELGARSYDIVIARGSLIRAGDYIGQVKPYRAAAVVTDKTVAGLHAPALLQSLKTAGIDAKLFTVAPGEASKSFAILEKLVGDLVHAGIERGSLIVALGGGVVGDLAGFAAAITLRGIDYVQIPTTLLAQVDSSVGGKTGINLPHGKNLVGAFHQPRLVVIDPAVLDTLDARQKRAGSAEIVKMALISDAAFFEQLEKNRCGIEQQIHRACSVKAEIVARDERENNERMLLNLGHTFGHALEALTGYGDALLHGEAVAIGIGMAFRFSVQLGLCPPQDAARVERYLEKAGLPASARHLGLSSGKFLAGMQKDKKTADGKLNLVLVRGIGKAFVARDIEQAKLASFLQNEVNKS